LKSFACGDVVPGCTVTFTGPDDDSVLGQVAAHAVADHGLGSIPPELVEQVRASIVLV
jgi:predicted small metal-binding protein